MINFALTGAAGFVAPRHLGAIRAVGGRLVAALDPHDAVGILDQFSFETRFFTEFERFDRHLEKLRRSPDGDRVHYLSVCTPNYLHDAHIRLALRVGANAICEKPLVINPWNLAPLQELESETGCRVYTVLQLRLHPMLQQLASKVQNGHYQIDLKYVAARGRWYDSSWKTVPEKSGGVATNIGIHLFDMLLWLFGPVEHSEVHHLSRARGSGHLRLERADVNWFLSTERSDLPFEPQPGGRTSYRRIAIDGTEVDFTDGMTDLHTRVYEDILAGRGLGIEDARPSIELVHQIRTAGLPASV
jgi:UDP-N-acetyl-2-amino-2-deoxyglucuronate dehydrogenase